jgi:hypothetical protein
MIFKYVFSPLPVYLSSIMLAPTGVMKSPFSSVVSSAKRGSSYAGKSTTLSIRTLFKPQLSVVKLVIRDPSLAALAMGSKLASSLVSRQNA